MNDKKPLGDVSICGNPVLTGPNEFTAHLVSHLVTVDVSLAEPNLS